MAGQYSKKLRSDPNREGSALIPYNEDSSFTEALLDWVETPAKKPKERKIKMAKRDTRIENRNGVTHVVDVQSGKSIRILLNPAQKRRKYVKELKTKKNAFNEKPLSNTQLAFRSGYMAANKEQTRIFKKKNPGYQRKSK